MSSDFSALHRDHLARLDQWLAISLDLSARSGAGFDSVLFHAGRPQVYHRDDREIRFWPNAHFRRWIPPQGGPEHVVWVRPGHAPTVVRVLPSDYWYDTEPPPPSHWEGAVDVRNVSSFDQVRDALGQAFDPSGVAFVGESADAAATLGIAAGAIEPPALMAPLDWYRAIKTDYEIALTRVACQAAARGHLRARKAFFDGASECELHRRYLEAAGHLEGELPYDSIIAFGHKSAILHYQHKRGDEAAPGVTCLVDAGGTHCGYAADLTRTWATDDAHPVFRQLIAELDATERHLVSMVGPGRSYVDLHLEAHRRAASTLVRLGILRCSADEALDLRLTRVFFPHGVGHLIGLQVHDVAGQQTAPEGGTTPPPDGHVLRNTRTMEPGHLVTIEPGLYFIPLLLDPQREGEHADRFDWQLIDQLIPCGGVRIEDDVVCTADGFDDLSRDLIEGTL